MLFSFGAVLIPILLHYVISEMVFLAANLTGLKGDASGLTLVTALITLPIAVWLFHRDGGWKEMTKIQGRDIFSLILCFAAGALANMVWSRLIELLGASHSFSNEVVESLLHSSKWTLIMGPGIFVPVAEEFVFRGLVYKRLRKYMGSDRRSVLLSMIMAAALFALYHGNPMQILFAFPLSLLLCLIYEKRKWIGFPIAFHIGVNMFAVIVTVAGLMRVQ